MDYHLTVFSLLVTIMCIIITYVKIQQNVLYGAKIDNCPFCFGLSFCDILKQEQVELDSSYFITNVINSLFINKRVLFAKWKDKKIVLKTLGYSGQIRLKNLVDKQNLVSTFRDEETIKNSIHNIFLSSLKDYSTQDIKLCPNTNHINLLLSLILEDVPILTEESYLKLLDKYINIWTLLQANSESIVQKVLKGWPIATYLGSCGYTTASEYCGEMLTTFAERADWNTRVNISQQLLKMALKFTLDHTNFRFYFTDISADNMAVSEKGIVKFIDVENVIIVDKNPTEIPFNWNMTHRSENYETQGFTFSPENLCNHHVSDHNLYAVCQEILGKTSPLIPNGLLYSPPQASKAKLNLLLDECIGGENRFKAVTKLLQVLQEEMDIH